MSSTGLWTRASEAAADQLCPGRWQAQQGSAERGSSPDSEWGRAIHKALDKRDPTGLTTDQRDIYESCQEIEGRMIVQYFGPDAAAAMARAWREMEFTLEHEGWEHRGHPDAVYRFSGRALIVDYKTLPGEQAVSPEHQQLRDYVVLVGNNFVLIDQIGVVVIQPLVTHNPHICVYTRADIERATEEMWKRIAVSRGPDPQRIAGEVQCQYCGAKANCTQYQQWATSKLPVPKSLLDVPVAQWSKEQRRTFCDQYDVAQRWLNETWDAMVKGALADPDFVPGYSMKPGATLVTQQAHILRTDKAQELFNRFQALGGTLEQFMGCVGVVGASFKDAVASVTQLSGKALDNKYKAIIGDLVTNKTNASSLKPKKS